MNSNDQITSHFKGGKTLAEAVCNAMLEVIGEVDV